jgi:hypothetical protein
MRARNSTAGMTDCRSSFLRRQFREVLDRTMVVPGKAVAEAVELARESGTPVRRKPEEIYDSSFMSNLEKSGFLKEIWGSENYRR